MPGPPRGFLLLFQPIPDLKRLVCALAPDGYSVVSRSEKEDLLRLPGQYVQAAVAHLEKLSKAGEKPGDQQM